MSLLEQVSFQKTLRITRKQHSTIYLKYPYPHLEYRVIGVSRSISQLIQSKDTVRPWTSGLFIAGPQADKHTNPWASWCFHLASTACLWEEAADPGQNPGKHRQNRKTPLRKATSPGPEPMTFFLWGCRANHCTQYYCTVTCLLPSKYHNRLADWSQPTIAGIQLSGFKKIWEHLWVFFFAYIFQFLK